MVICNREQEILDDSSSSVFTYYMNEALGFAGAYELEYAAFYQALAEVSLERKKDSDYTAWATLYEPQIEILSYPTEDPSEIEYP